MKKYKVDFKEVEYGSVKVKANNTDEAREKADDIISKGNANYGKNERFMDNPIEDVKNEKVVDKMNKNFEVKGICRADLINSIGEKKAMKVDDGNMRYIADKMGDYLQDDYWNCLDEVLCKMKLL